MKNYSKALNNKPVTPFLKWAGGKRWLVDDYSQLFTVKYNNYFEPFLGSGAVFFYLLPEKSTLSDYNTSLINTYNAIKDDWERVYHELEKHSRYHSAEYYYKIRNMVARNNYTRAAQFIYLNRTCWNGLYRVNLKGKFNVPKGTKNRVILDTDNFEFISRLLFNAEIRKADFEETINQTKRGDLLFVDPPYTVNHNKNGFLKYNERIFSWDDQIRLSAAIKSAKKRGVKILLTNADHDSIRNLYRDNFNIITLKRRSVISGSSKYRGIVNELLVSCNL